MYFQTMNAIRTLSALIFFTAITSADAQENPQSTSAAVPAQSEMQKWIATLDAQWQAVFARDVTAPTEAEKVKLWEQYLAAVEAAITKATGAADLDTAVAWRKERDRFSSAKDVPTEDEAGIFPALKPFRASWRAQNAKIQKDRGERAKAVHARYDQVLGAAQAQLTQAQRLDDALLVKAKRAEVAAAWLGPVPPGTSGAVAVSVPPTVAKTVAPVTKPPTVPIPVGARFAENVRIHASGNNGCIIAINGKEIGKVGRDKPGTFSHRLRDGDIIAVKLTDRFDINSFWLSCIASSGEFLFETSEQWTSYLPGDAAKWWNIKSAKEQKPAQFAPDRQEYVDLVKKSAAQTPLYTNAQPIRSVLDPGSRTAWLFYVVTKADLVLKPPAK